MTEILTAAQIIQMWERLPFVSGDNDAIRFARAIEAAVAEKYEAVREENSKLWNINTSLAEKTIDDRRVEDLQQQLELIKLRQPLGDWQVHKEASKWVHKEAAFEAGVRWAEQQHGITETEDE